MGKTRVREHRMYGLSELPTLPMARLIRHRDRMGEIVPEKTTQLAFMPDGVIYEMCVCRFWDGEERRYGWDELKIRHIPKLLDDPENPDGSTLPRYRKKGFLEMECIR